MAQGEKPLPEGTDAILDEDGIDAALDETTELQADLDELDEEPVEEASFEPRPAGDGAASDGAQDPKAAFFGKFEDLRGQATDKAFAFAQAGKDRATGAIDDVVRMVEDAADDIDAKIGTQYGDYARRAAQGLGGFADAFKGKEVDELFADARELVKKSPAVAIGAAAALGFVVARLVKAGIPDTTVAEDTSGSGPGKKAA